MIAEFWRQMTRVYGDKWARVYGEYSDDSEHVAAWQKALEHVPLCAIAGTIARCSVGAVGTPNWPPTIKEFCLRARGIPSFVEFFADVRARTVRTPFALHAKTIIGDRCRFADGPQEREILRDVYLQTLRHVLAGGDLPTVLQPRESRPPVARVQPKAWGARDIERSLRNA